MTVSVKSARSTFVANMFGSSLVAVPFLQLRKEADVPDSVIGADRRRFRGGALPHRSFLLTRGLDATHSRATRCPVAGISSWTGRPSASRSLRSCSPSGAGRSGSGTSRSGSCRSFRPMRGSGPCAFCPYPRLPRSARPMESSVLIAVEATPSTEPSLRCLPEPEVSKDGEHHDHEADDVKNVVHVLPPFCSISF
jgi:hypothetical protein